MKKLFECYKNLLQQRLNTRPLLLIGEDAIRYDFFYAITETYRLKPAQIDIELPINEQAFIPNNNKKSFRNEKPLLDLMVNVRGLNISVEFGLFKQNSNELGTINKTSRLVKILNDMVRVSLHAHFTQTKGLFVCVADYKMLGHQLRSNLLERFPSNYIITNEIIDYQLAQKTNHFDRRFLNVYQPLKTEIHCKLIYNEILTASKISKETRVLIWEALLNPSNNSNESMNKKPAVKVRLK